MCKFQWQALSFLLIEELGRHGPFDLVLQEALAVLLCALCSHDNQSSQLSTVSHRCPLPSGGGAFLTLNAVTSAAYGPLDLSSGMGTPPSIMPEYE